MEIVFQFAINFPEAFFRCLVPFRPNRSIHCIRIVTHFKCHLLRHGSRKRYVCYLPHYARRSSAYCICALCTFFPRFFVLIFLSLRHIVHSSCLCIVYIFQFENEIIIRIVEWNRWEMDGRRKQQQQQQNRVAYRVCYER